VPVSRSNPSSEEPLTLATLRAELAGRARLLAPTGGSHQLSQQLGLTVFRSDALNSSVSGVYEPCVAVILQGSKRLVVGDDTLSFDARHYLVCTLDLPTSMTLLEASPQRPYLSLMLPLDLREIAGLMLEAPTNPHKAGGGGPIASGAVTPSLLDAFRRLLDLLEQPEDMPSLAPLFRREIFYRLLVGPAGNRLRQISTVGAQGHRIARVIARLKTRYAEDLRIEDLARDARMSGTTFHQHFRALTSMSPLQYQKQLRLIEARRLMLAENLDAAAAAYRVGYESPTQFSREYGRQFGAPPARDMARLRGAQIPGGKRMGPPPRSTRAGHLPGRT